MSAETMAPYVYSGRLLPILYTSSHRRSLSTMAMKLQTFRLVYRSHEPHVHQSRSSGEFYIFHFSFFNRVSSSCESWNRRRYIRVK